MRQGPAGSYKPLHFYYLTLYRKKLAHPCRLNKSLLKILKTFLKQDLATSLLSLKASRDILVPNGHFHQCL